MTNKQFLALERQLSYCLPGFHVSPGLMHLEPIGRLLRGIAFDGSSFDKISFYVTVFVMPLCVPTTYLYFTYGQRIDDRWSVGEPDTVERLAAAITTQALPFLLRTATLEDFIELAEEKRQDDPNNLWALGLALARIGRDAEAVDVLGRMERWSGDPVGWVRGLSQRAMAFRQSMLQDASDAREQLQGWELETIEALRLNRPPRVSRSQKAPKPSR